MWRITLMLNFLLMCVFSLGSLLSQFKLHNAFVQYPEAGAGSDLPAGSELALKLQWLFPTVPLIWAAFTLALMVLLWKKKERARDVVQLHTSATLLVGTTMLLFFVLAGIAPFVSFVVGM